MAEIEKYVPPPVAEGTVHLVLSTTEAVAVYAMLGRTNLDTYVDMFSGKADELRQAGNRAFRALNTIPDIVGKYGAISRAPYSGTLRLTK